MDGWLMSSERGKQEMQLEKNITRCYGYECNLKRQCQRYLTMAIDKPGLYSYMGSMCSVSMFSNDKTTKCDKYIDAGLYQSTPRGGDVPAI